ncbi:MAG: hypothetical protein P8L39_16730 [Halioglobus sp.]|nr:hypothetical protein [Halioglobus sp.]
MGLLKARHEFAREEPLATQQAGMRCVGAVGGFSYPLVPDKNRVFLWSEVGRPLASFEGLSGSSTTLGVQGAARPENLPAAVLITLDSWVLQSKLQNATARFAALSGSRL